MNIVSSVQRALTVGGQLTTTGWVAPPDLTREQWEQVADGLARVDQSKQWWTGDWWNAGQKDGWGDGRETCERSGIDYEQARKCGSICGAIELLRRRNNLSFGHHQEVCAIDDPAVQDRMMDWCEEPIAQGGKPRSTRELREQVRAYLDEQGWAEGDRERRDAVRRGKTVVANQKTDDRLIRWATFEGVAVKIDRMTEWGNPYELDKDGDRDYCCDAFETHLSLKKSLHKKLAELRGKVLLCWCHPQRCHGHHLAAMADNPTEGA